MFLTETYLYKKEDAAEVGLETYGLAEIVVVPKTEYDAYVELAKPEAVHTDGSHGSYAIGTKVPLLNKDQFRQWNRILDYYYTSGLYKTQSLRAWLESVQTGTFDTYALIGIKKEQFKAIRQAFGFTPIKEKVDDGPWQFLLTSPMRKWWENYESSCDQTTWKKFPLRQLFIMGMLQNYGISFPQWCNPSM